jgi:rhodanese-related sulfurtransferase
MRPEKMARSNPGAQSDQKKDHQVRVEKMASRWLVTAAATALLLGGASSLLAQGKAPASDSTKQLQIKPGPLKGERRHVNNTRGTSFCGVAAFIGTPPNATAHIYTSSSCQECTEEDAKRIDPVALAKEIGVTQCGVNIGRFWMMDELSFGAGEAVNFHGVKMVWVGSMNPDEVHSYFGGKAYVPVRITRDTEWIYKAGKPVYLLRTPEGKVWVLQEYCNDVDTTLTADNLDQLRDTLKLPKGWKFETNILAKDLSLNTSRSGGRAFIMRDDLGNAYQGVGFDNSASYVPSTATAKGNELHKAKQTTLGLYVTAAEAYEMWRAAPDKVKVIDVRTPEEYAAIGHPEMAWNIPIAFVTYEWTDGKFKFGAKPNPDFVTHVKEIAQPTDILLLTCRSGGRGAMAVNQLAAAGFTNAHNIVDGVEGDLVTDPTSAYHGKRMKNGWKNCAPWVYGIDPEKIILEEGTSRQED